MKLAILAFLILALASGVFIATRASHQASEQAHRDTEKANRAITDMNQRMFSQKSKP